MLNHAENRYSWPKNGRLMVIFLLGKIPQSEPTNTFSPSFHYKFSMIILSNIFQNERFQIKNGQNVPFFGKNCFIKVKYLGALS